MKREGGRYLYIHLYYRSVIKVEVQYAVMKIYNVILCGSEEIPLVTLCNE